jgi:hypothetical protein
VPVPAREAVAIMPSSSATAPEAGRRFTTLTTMPTSRTGRGSREVGHSGGASTAG